MSNNNRGELCRTTSISHLNGGQTSDLWVYPRLHSPLFQFTPNHEKPNQKLNQKILSFKGTFAYFLRGGTWSTKYLAGKWAPLSLSLSLRFLTHRGVKEDYKNKAIFVVEDQTGFVQ